MRARWLHACACRRWQHICAQFSSTLRCVLRMSQPPTLELLPRGKSIICPRVPLAQGSGCRFVCDVCQITLRWPSLAPREPLPVKQWLPCNPITALSKLDRLSCLLVFCCACAVFMAFVQIKCKGVAHTGHDEERMMAPRRVAVCSPGRRSEAWTAAIAGRQLVWPWSWLLGLLHEQPQVTEK